MNKIDPLPIKKPNAKSVEVANKILLAEKKVLHENRWDTWHVGGVREHLTSIKNGN